MFLKDAAFYSELQFLPLLTSLQLWTTELMIILSLRL